MDTPYIVSEISASSYEAVSSSVFVLGDENGTRISNGFPEQYRNGPLQEGTQYSVFVWAFIPAIPPSSVSGGREGGQEGGQEGGTEGGTEGGGSERTGREAGREVERRRERGNLTKEFSICSSLRT